mmetsp:Transcript_50687/g.156501  ORF Transcript_50687/g.156501 Transcript_50687/m.156501 type:complete len:110 (-) Transcript_50687:158-487(-)
MSHPYTPFPGTAAVLSTGVELLRAGAWFVDVFRLIVSDFRNDGDLCMTAGIDAETCHAAKLGAVVVIAVLVFLALRGCGCKRTEPHGGHFAVCPATPRSDDVSDDASDC